MFIIIQEIDNYKKILHIIETINEYDVQKWISEYLINTITSLDICPVQKDVKNVSYQIEDIKNTSILKKRYKKIYKGYIYNSSNWKETEIMNISYLKCDNFSLKLKND